MGPDAFLSKAVTGVYAVPLRASIQPPSLVEEPIVCPIGGLSLCESSAVSYKGTGILHSIVLRSLQALGSYPRGANAQPEGGTVAPLALDRLNCNGAGGPSSGA